MVMAQNIQNIFSRFFVESKNKANRDKLSPDEYFSDPRFIKYCNNISKDDIEEGTMDDLFEEILGPYESQKK